MEEFECYLTEIENEEHRARLREILLWIMERFPTLSPRVSWNQPMFTDHGTFIIGFSTAKSHIAVAPERAGILRFSEEIVQAGYEHSKMLIRMKWSAPVNYPLLGKIIQYNRSDKADCKTFWRK